MTDSGDAALERRAPRLTATRRALHARLQGMAPLAPIPSERDLAAELGVSRTTIRRTLAELARDGEISRLPGKGTFSAGRRYVDHEMQSFIGFDEDARMQRRTVTNRVLLQTVTTAPGRIAGLLEIGDADPVFVLRRLRFVDAEPICITAAHIPLELCPALPDQDFTSASLYEFLRQQGIATSRARRSLEVHKAEAEQAAHLGIPTGSPVILFESLGRTAGDQPLDHVQSCYPAYKARFESDVSVDTGRS